MAASEWVVVRLRVQDKNQFIRDILEAGAAIEVFNKEADKAALAQSRATKRSFLMSQAMFTLRRAVYNVTQLFGIAAAGATAWGLQFDATMEQQTIAMTRFMGSTTAAKKELDFLWHLAAIGPFNFQPLLQGTRQLMAFGVSAQDANRYMSGLSDAMAAMGLDESAIQRATLALGQIQSSGRLLGQDLRQLEQLGLVNPVDLARRLNINPAQIGNIGQLGVPSKVAIDAIVAYWQERFGGATRDFGKTFMGELSTIHDYAQKAFGEMAKPLFNYLRDTLFPALVRILPLAERGFEEGKFTGMFKAIDQATGGAYHLSQAWKILTDLSKNLVAVAKPLLDIFVGAAKDLAPLLGILELIAWALGGLAWALNLLKPILKPLVALMIADFLVTKLLALWTRVLALRKIFLYIWEMRLSRAIRLVVAWMFMENRMLILAAVLTAAWTRAMILLEAAMAFFTEGLAAASIAFLVSPIGLVILAIVALVAAVILIIIYWKQVKAAIMDTWSWIKANWPIILVFLISPIAGMVWLVIKYFDQIKAAAQALYDFLKGLFKKIFGWFGKILGKVGGGILGALNPFGGGGGFPFMASGGVVETAGMAIVGEKGPEVTWMPRGARVSPLPDVPMSGVVESWRQRSQDIVVPITLNVDGRKLAEAVVRRQSDVAARA